MAGSSRLDPGAASGLVIGLEGMKARLRACDRATGDWPSKVAPQPKKLEFDARKTVFTQEAGTPGGIPAVSH